MTTGEFRGLGKFALVSILSPLRLPVHHSGRASDVRMVRRAYPSVKKVDFEKRHRLIEDWMRRSLAKPRQKTPNEVIPLVRDFASQA